MTNSSEINATYYAIRLISHRIDVSHLRRNKEIVSSLEEFTSEERKLAFEIIQGIQESEGILIQNLSESRAEIYLNLLANRVEELADIELAQANYDFNQADRIIEKLRHDASRATEHASASNKSVSPSSQTLLGKLQVMESNSSSHLQQAMEDSLSDIKLYDTSSGKVSDLICLSHLRWDFVYQRPQHLMNRFARERRVFFIEEPVLGESALRLDVSQREDGVYVVVPHLPQLQDEDWVVDAMQQLINRLFKEYEIGDHILWYYTPMAIEWTRDLNPLAVVYDCMDELSAFKGASPVLKEREAELFSRADLVFAGGQSLYEAKREQHPNVYAFPSSIDSAHFAKARQITAEPSDQADILHPRLGFFGVLDERIDIELLDGIAAARPDWQIIMIGPVVKIDPTALPRRSNIHYLGSKSYKELPGYLAGWDVALLPFARDESTRFISPTKTPEYLAAGCAVVSTSIRDVVRPYGQMGLVYIADTPEEFVAAVEAAMMSDVAERLREVDAFLSQTSWDRTWKRMNELIEDVVASRLVNRASSSGVIVPRTMGRATIPLASLINM